MWHLALSSLPLFHNDCLPVHLKNVASFLYTALLRASTLRTSSSGGGRREGGETAESVASDFLHSVGFQDVRNLHESLLDHCFEQAALALPKRLNTHICTHMNKSQNIHNIHMPWSALQCYVRVHLMSCFALLCLDL